MSCGKLLLDEKIRLCKRCRLEGRNKMITKIGGAGAGTVAIAMVINSAVNGMGNDDDVTQSL